MTESTPGGRTTKPAAMCGLILLMLHESGGVVLDDTGRVASRVRRHFGIADTQTNNACISEALQQLAREGAITRRMDDAQRRTYDITLVTPLTDDAAAALIDARKNNLARFVNQPPRTELEQLIRECVAGYEALQRARKDAKRVRANGSVAINATGILRALGYTRLTIERIKYYLRLLGIAQALTAVNDEPDVQLWWWSISDQPLSIERLRELATGDRSYEACKARKYGTPEAGEVTVRRIDPPAATTPATIDPPPTAVPASARPVPKPAPPRQAPVVKPTTGVVPDDPYEAVVVIAERLEARNRQLEAENAELRAAATARDAAHQQQVDELNEQNRQLKLALERRESLNGRAAGFIARMGGVNAPTS